MPTTTTSFLHIIVLRSKLADALGAVASSVGLEGASLPALKAVKVQASGGAVTLSATDLDVATEYSFSGKVTQEGACVVPFQVFFGIVKHVPSERIELQTEGGALRISSDNYEASVRVQDAEEFPIIPVAEESWFQCFLAGADMHEAFFQVAFSTQYSDIRPEISGVYVHSEDGGLAFVATDSFRLAKYSVSGEGREFPEELAFTLPIRSVQDLLKLGSGEEGSVKIFLGEGQIFFEAESWRFTSRLVSGAFPDYTQIIPREFKGGARLDRGQFLEGVKLVSSLSGKTHDMAVETGGNKKFLEIRASDSALGENAYRVPAKISGDSFSVVFNWRYISQGLQVCEGKEVELQVGGAEKPSVIRSFENARFLYVVMPIKG